MLSGTGDDAKLQAVQIRTGISDGISTEVLSGLDEGAQVVTGVVLTGTQAAGASNPFGGGFPQDAIDFRFSVQTNPVIKLADIHKMYHTGEVDVHAVRGITLEIFPGEFVALMGASGSGKSTLMNMIGALDRPTGGNYLLDGIDVSTLDRDALADVRNEKIGFVFQGFNLLSRTSALENVEMPMLYNRHRIQSHEQQRARPARARSGRASATRADHHPNQLSGGQQQRVAIARALVNQPSLLLADEPTGNLDSQTSIEIMGVFQKLNDQGITIVMVTHELDMARYTRRMVILRDGNIVTDDDGGQPSERGKRIAAAPGGTTGRETRVMRIFASLKIAGRALRRNKMRSLLTMLGIIIGVGAVIGSVSLTTGATKQVEDQVASLGENVITVFSGNFTSGGMRGGWGSAPTLTVDDAKAIAELPNVVAVSPEVRDRAQILANGLNWNTQVMGESPDYPQIRQSEHRQRRDVHRPGRAQPRQIRRHRQNRRRPVVSRRKSARPDSAHPEHPVSDRRRAHAERLQSVRPGPGRHCHRSLHQPHAPHHHAHVFELTFWWRPPATRPSFSAQNEITDLLHVAASQQGTGFHRAQPGWT